MAGKQGRWRTNRALECVLHYVPDDRIAIATILGCLRSMNFFFVCFPHSSVHLLPWSYTSRPEFLFDKRKGGLGSYDPSVRFHLNQEVKFLAEKLVSEAKLRARYTRHSPNAMWLWGTSHWWFLILSLFACC